MLVISRTFFCSQILSFVILYSSPSGAASSSQRPIKPKIPSFDWSTLKPSSELSWHDCYSPSFLQNEHQHIFSPQSIPKSRTYSCARLSLPLDYHNTSNPQKVIVPILKISSPPSPSHRGTIFTALGGAGNSRIQDFVSIGSDSEFFNWIDPEYEFDFLTFDNRGFGYSSPSARCFDNVMDGKLWEERVVDLGGVLNSKEEGGSQVMLAASKAIGELCAQNEEQDVDIRKHMTTAYAARDMLEILKRLPNHPKEQEHVQFPKLNFLGISYGTMVGQTFASMYPEYVDRMVLDGTIDGKDWTGKWQMQHLVDSDAIWASFFVDCFEAQEACPLWRSSDLNSTAGRDRVDAFWNKLQQRPLFTISDGNARLITYRDVKMGMYWTTMAPVSGAPAMASILDNLMRGHTNIVLGFPFEEVSKVPECSDKETDEDSASYNSDAGRALNCGDAEDITNSTIKDFKEYLAALENQSSTAAFFQGERKMRCMGWPIRPVWRYTGPFSTAEEDGSSKLSTPILFLSNKLDPMTSISTAREVAREYPGSVVLEQCARGHTVLANAVPSPCIIQHVRGYFRTGDLPESGTACGEECNWFDGSCLVGENLYSDPTALFR